MALINKVDNVASITYDGAPILSNSVSTVLLLPPAVVKTVDKVVASVGDILTYNVTITNVGLSQLTNLPFSDVIATGAGYVPNSFKVNGTAETPGITNNTLTYTIPSIPSLGTANVQFQVRVLGGSI